MDRYYYLICSLPMLNFAAKPPMTSQGFINEAEAWLSEDDFYVLSMAGINSFLPHKTDTPLLRAWKEFESSLRGELTLFRAAKAKGDDYKLKRELGDIIEEGNNPLEIEKKLLSLRWNFLEEQESGHFFDLGFLIIYFLKLQVLERLSSFDKQKGWERFEDYSLVK